MFTMFVLRPLFGGSGAERSVRRTGTPNREERVIATTGSSCAALSNEKLTDNMGFL